MVREVTLVLEGKVNVAEIVDGMRTEFELEEGDFAVFDPCSCHTMENRSNAQARTLTFKFLGREKDIELFATDKLKNCKGPVKLKTINDCDPRYGPYINLYNNLDKLQWQVPGFLIAVSAIVFGFTYNFNFNTKQEALIPPFTHYSTVGFIFVLGGILYILGVYTMKRIRMHHCILGEELEKLELSGYFHRRNEIRKKCWPPEDADVIMCVFTILSFVFIGIGFYNIFRAFGIT